MATKSTSTTAPEDEKVTVTDLEAPLRDVRDLLKVATHLLLENIPPSFKSDEEREEAFEQCGRGLTLLTTTGEKVDKLQGLWERAYHNRQLGGVERGSEGGAVMSDGIDLDKAREYLLVIGRALKFKGEMSEEEQSAIEQLIFDTELLLHDEADDEEQPAGNADA